MNQYFITSVDYIVLTSVHGSTETSIPITIDHHISILDVHGCMQCVCVSLLLLKIWTDACALIYCAHRSRAHECYCYEYS